MSLSRAAQKPDTPLAWLMVAVAFVASFVVFGITYSFGVFFKPMAAEFHASRAATSALFSITGFADYMLASLTGHLSDRFGPRIVVGAGAVMMGLGLGLTAFIGHMWVGYLTYGAGVGLGAACVYIPTLAIVGGWFSRRRNTALGIAAAGTGFGTLIVPPFSAALIVRYGWRTTYLILGAGSAVLLIGCALLVEAPPLKFTAAKKHPLGRIVRSREFVLLYISWFLATTALLVPFVYLPSFARDHGASEVAAASLISLIGGVSIVSRLGLGPLGDRMGTVRLFKATVFIMGISYALWLALPAYGWLMAFAIVLGLSYGARISLMPGVLIEFFGLQNLGALLGVFFTSSGFSTVLGPPLAGLVVDYTGSYQWGIAFALAMGLLGFAAVIPLREHVATDEQTAVAGV
ncbi:MAG: MCT family MFS transporter [Candidatus Binataceae bacterium]